MNIKTILMLSSSIEFVTGLALILTPNLLANVLLSTDLTSSGEAVARVGGFGLLSLAIACWPRGESDHPQSVRALFLYNLLAACYLGYLRFSGDFHSPFLLPASVLHAILALLLARRAYETLTNNNPNR